MKCKHDHGASCETQVPVPSTCYEIHLASTLACVPFGHDLMCVTGVKGQERI